MHLINVYEKQSDYIDFNKYSQYLFHKNKSRTVMLSIETVNICNNDCIICAYGSMSRNKSVMKMDLFEKILHDYSDIGGGVFTLTPMVGDVFMDDLLLERYKVLENYPLIGQPSFTTNAIMSKKFKDDDLRFILKNTKAVQISVYGMDDEEYLLMTKRNEFNSLIANIQRLLNLVDDVSKIKLGFRSLKKFNSKDYSDWIIKHFGTDIPFAYTNSYSNWGIFDTNKKLPFAATWTSNETKKMQCLLPMVSCQIFSDGEVSFCPCDDFDNNEELHIGSIANENLLEIYNTEKVKNLWNFENHVPEYCQSCSFYIPIDALQENEFLFEYPQKFFGE